MRLPGSSTSKMRKLAVPGAWLRAMRGAEAVDRDGAGDNGEAVGEDVRGREGVRANPGQVDGPAATGVGGVDGGNQACRAVDVPAGDVGGVVAPAGAEKATVAATVPQERAATAPTTTNRRPKVPVDEPCWSHCSNFAASAWTILPQVSKTGPAAASGRANAAPLSLVAHAEHT